MPKDEKYFSVVLNQENFSSKTENSYVTGKDIVSDLAYALGSDLLTTTTDNDSFILIRKFLGLAKNIVYNQKQNTITLFFTEDEAREYLGYDLAEDEVVSADKLAKNIIERLIDRVNTRGKKNKIRFESKDYLKNKNITESKQKWVVRAINSICITAGLLVFLLTIWVGVFFNQTPQCKDGWSSFSIGQRGACSYHGGVDRSNPGALFFILSPITGGFTGIFTWLLLSEAKKNKKDGTSD